MSENVVPKWPDEVWCPSCAAMPGEVCRGFRPGHFHASRIEAAKRGKQAAAKPAAQTRKRAVSPMKAGHEGKREKIRQLYIRDGRRCFWCGRELLALDEIPKRSDGKIPDNYPTLDHVEPRSRGGRHGLQNLVVSCPACNQNQADRPARERPRRPAAVPDDTNDCPDCSDGLWANGDGRLCPTCDGAGALTAARATALFIKARQQRDQARRDRRFEKAARLALRHIVEKEMGPGSHRRGLAGTVQRQRELIRTLGERIDELKVQLAREAGHDLERMIPHAGRRARALGVSAGCTGEETR